MSQTQPKKTVTIALEKEIDRVAYLVSPEKYKQLTFAFLMYPDIFYTYVIRYSRLPTEFATPSGQSAGPGGLVEFTASHPLTAALPIAGGVLVVGFASVAVAYDQQIQEQKARAERYTRVMDNILQDKSKVDKINEILQNILAAQQRRKGSKVLEGEYGSIRLSLQDGEKINIVMSPEVATSKKKVPERELEVEKKWYVKYVWEPLKYLFWDLFLEPIFIPLMDALGTASFFYSILWMAAASFAAAFALGMFGASPWLFIVIPAFFGLIYLAKQIRNWIGSKFPEVLSSDLSRKLGITYFCIDSERPFDWSFGIGYWWINWLPWLAARLIEVITLIVRLIYVFILALIIPFYAFYKWLSPGKEIMEEEKPILVGSKELPLTAEMLPLGVRQDAMVLLDTAFTIMEAQEKKDKEDANKKAEQANAAAENKPLEEGEQSQKLDPYYQKLALADMLRDSTTFGFRYWGVTSFLLAAGSYGLAQFNVWFLSDFFFPVSDTTLVGSIIIAVVAIVYMLYKAISLYQDYALEKALLQKSYPESPDKPQWLRESLILHKNFVAEIDKEYWAKFNLWHQFWPFTDYATGGIFLVRCLLLAGTSVFAFIATNPFTAGITVAVMVVVGLIFAICKIYQSYLEGKNEFLHQKLTELESQGSSDKKIGEQLGGEAPSDELHSAPTVGHELVAAMIPDSVEPAVAQSAQGERPTSESTGSARHIDTALLTPVDGGGHDRGHA